LAKIARLSHVEQMAHGIAQELNPRLPRNGAEEAGIKMHAERVPGREKMKLLFGHRDAANSKRAAADSARTSVEHRPATGRAAITPGDNWAEAWCARPPQGF
jgi:hypothetical protein